MIDLLYVAYSIGDERTTVISKTWQNEPWTKSVMEKMPRTWMGMVYIKFHNVIRLNIMHSGERDLQNIYADLAANTKHIAFIRCIGK